MKVTLESTATMVTFVLDNGGEVPSRIWQGETEDGTPVFAFITRIGPAYLVTDPDIDAKTAQFDCELTRCAAPRAYIESLPLKLVL
jgi:hypothetical protein